MSNSNNHGGVRPGAGRPTKSDEQKLIDKLSPLDPLVIKAIKEGVTEGNYKFVNLYMNYMYGKPKERMEVSNHSHGMELIDKLLALDEETIKQQIEDE